MINLLTGKWTLDGLTKLLGAIAVGGYVLGYLVLSFHLSAYGFNPVSPFRSRVLETGICALILFAMPYMIGMGIGSLSSRGTAAFFMIPLRLICLPILCSLMAGFPGFIGELPRTFLLTFPAENRWVAIAKVLLIPLGLYLLSTAAKWIWRHYHDRKLLSIVILLPISAIFLLSGTDKTNTSAQVRTFLWLLSWSTFFVLAIGDHAEASEQKWIDNQTKEIRKLGVKIDKLLGELGRGGEIIPQPDPVRDLETMKQQNAIMLAEYDSPTSVFRKRGFIFAFGPLLFVGLNAFAIAAFANWMYPYIPMRLGGGEILAVSLFEASAGQPVHVVHARLLDQSDQGFFVLMPGDNKGLFLPKERIEAIYFSDDASRFELPTKAP